MIPQDCAGSSKKSRYGQEKVDPQELLSAKGAAKQTIEKIGSLQKKMIKWKDVTAQENVDQFLDKHIGESLQTNGSSHVQQSACVEISYRIKFS